jgi:hypothetical protein
MTIKLKIMKHLLLTIGIFILFVNNVNAQNQTIDVYKYANLNDPIFQKNVNLWKQEQEMFLVIFQKHKYPDAEESKSIGNIRKQHDKNWRNAGLSPIMVQDKNAKKEMEDAIWTEITRLMKIIKQKKEAIPYAASLDPKWGVMKSLAAFDEGTKTGRLRAMVKMIRIGKIQNTVKQKANNSNLEAEFLAEIAKINADIAVINRLAQSRQILASFNKSQILCDKLSRYQGDHYFSRSLKKIRKEKPGFSFSIRPLAEEVTREYWIRMRNRANLAYRNALDAHKGCVWNEGIQDAGFVEIPYAYFKLGFDLFQMSKDIMEKSFYGTLQGIYKAYQDPSKSLRPILLISEDVLKAGNDAYDVKAYSGLLGGVLSAYDNFQKAQAMVTEHVVQEDLISANRESAKRLIKSGKNLLQEFDKYRAFIDSHSSSIDCLRDKIMRIDLDNQSIKGDKVQVWGTGLYDYDPDKYLAMIKEAGEDLKNEYVYCEDFIKSLQIAVHLATTDYYMIEEKVRNSGADKTQIDAQLSHNDQNGVWFDDESTRLSEYYIQFCDDEKNNYPDDVIIVSNKVIPGVEEQGGDPNAPPVWEYEDEEVFEPINEPKNKEPKQNNNNNNNVTTGGNYAPGIISKGNGWSAQKIENNPTAIQNDITNAINSGKTPAGIYVSDRTEVVVYYIEGNPLGMTAWNLENYNDATSLQNGISSNIDQGLFPMGISFTDQGKFYVLFINSQVKATAWQLVESQLDLGIVSANMQPWLDQQYVPVGITVYSGMYYTLMTQVPDTKITNWTIEGYNDNNNEIMQNVNTKINSGLLPFGYLKEGEVVNILYVGF